VILTVIGKRRPGSIARAAMLVMLAPGAISGASAASFYVSPDVPTSLSASTYQPSEILRNDSGVHSLEATLPAAASIDALFRLDDGRWLLSFDAPVTIASVTYLPNDVVLYDGAAYSLFFSGGSNGISLSVNVDAVFMEGGDGGNIVISCDVPCTIRGVTYGPADLVRYAGIFPSLFFDASAATPPIPYGSNVTAADVRGGLVVLSFDVPTTLGAGTYLPGELVAWDGFGFSSYFKDPAWPSGSRADAFSFLANPGEVPTLNVTYSTTTPGALTFTWSHGCSAGAEDYAIYEGAIGSWYSHKSVDCSDDGADFTEDVMPSAGNTYYLLVPINPNDEGFYGADSNGVTIPQGAPTCVATQVLGSQCP